MRLFSRKSHSGSRHARSQALAQEKARTGLMDLLGTEDRRFQGIQKEGAGYAKAAMPNAQQSAIDSEGNAMARGIRALTLARQNAIRASLGMEPMA